ncbi:MAG: tetratricopeptide repeat protein [Acidobacteria bacterium]|nr:tetratricopeptide repeat protein [Acidobacteriota bacterium]
MEGVFLGGLAVLLALSAASDSSRGLALYRQQQFQAAEKEFRASLARNPKDTTARLYLARTLVELGRIPEALAEINRTLDAQADPDVRFQAGRILRELAEQRLAALELAAPDSAPLHELAGRQFELKGDRVQALREYRAALALDPVRPGAHYWIGNILWKMRELDAAAEELRAELVASPHHAMANLRLGQALVARNQEAQALPYMERAVEAAPESLEARRELGKAYRKAGRLAEARREWEAVARARPEDDQVHYLLGNLYRELGEAVLAQRELERHRGILERRRARAERR